MAENSLKARRKEGGRYTPDDVIEIQFDYEGAVQLCTQHIEVISGPTVTHGGGAPAEEPLHYKAFMRDDGSSDVDGDGIIDYSFSEMTIVQQEMGTTVLRVVADVILKADHDAYIAEKEAWLAENTIETEEQYHESSQNVGRMTYMVDGNSYFTNEGVSMEDCPQYPEPTRYKSGELTLVYTVDEFV